ncbi:hypothetical protein GYMLUDRAFT_253594 [Collybiopsis luxurians FD-317 M1]|uniref:Uncharacterized protein n=1 Tax=Collybiopsis luxurians FD-317 M1 TaxID=944289 RepID=A0A0D0BW38_9AGAR|nr:hypothetical protein GYMLUDRAFT_253594 [Collybiopsis luxurians FD-317 M1]
MLRASFDADRIDKGKQGNRGELAEVSVELPQTGNAGPQAEKEESLSDDSNLLKAQTLKPTFPSRAGEDETAQELNASLVKGTDCDSTHAAPTTQHLALVPGPTMYPLRFPQDAKGIQWFENAFEFLNINLGGPYTAFNKSTDGKLGIAVYPRQIVLVN